MATMTTPQEETGLQGSLASQGFGDIAVSKIHTDLGHMFPPLLASPISRQAVEVGNAQLACKRLHDLGGYRHGIVEKGSEIANGGKLQR